MKHIIVTGDVTADWNIAILEKGMSSSQTWTAIDRSRACLQPGGAAMLGELISKSLKGTDSVVHSETLAKIIRPDNTGVHHSYAIWKPQLLTAKPKDKEEEKKRSWRVAEFIGIDTFCGGDSPKSCVYKVMEDLPEYADIVVIDDAGLGFRNKPAVWKKIINDNKKPKWIVVKMSSPVPEDKPDTLWTHLRDDHADHTMIITTLNDLRKNSIQVSREQSWEKLAQDLYWELVNNPQVNSLSKVAYVIVTIGTEGAFVLKRDNKEFEGVLYFEPSGFENSWNKIYPGSMIGYTVCLTAALVKELVANLDKPNIGMGIKAGIRGMRSLHITGYGSDSGKEIEWLKFPFDKVFSALGNVTDKKDVLASVIVPNPSEKVEKNKSSEGKRFWTILDDYINKNEEIDKNKNKRNLSITEIAKLIVLEGHEKHLKEVPIGKFNNFETADRREIEGFRSIKALLEQYVKEPLNRPLCIAVFGSPGSGKSFGIKQVASVVAKDKLQTITFNLSQFKESSALIDAFHQVRDISLSGKIPLVFWDEFDTDDLMWLRYFLAPMQDGEFQAGQITYHVGNAIFVFAGGTKDRMSRFDEGDYSKFKTVKGPDFISRLHGYLNILGPNQVELARGMVDTHFMIRRAILLRDMLRRHAPSLIDQSNGDKRLCIDDGIINAFLNISYYKYGARSMESIICGSLLAGKTYYERSCLPPRSLLDIHVIGLEFLALVQEPILEGELLDTLADKVHEVYSRQWPHDKNMLENRRNVLDIRNKLHSINYVMVPRKAGEPLMDIPKDEIEKLSIAEHDRWVSSKIEQLYTFAAIPKGDDKNKLHPSLVPWNKLSDEDWEKLDPKLQAAMANQDLPESEKEKDRALVKAIPEILDAVKYTIEKME